MEDLEDFQLLEHDFLNENGGLKPLDFMLDAEDGVTSIKYNRKTIHIYVVDKDVKKILAKKLGEYYIPKDKTVGFVVAKQKKY